MKIQKIQLPLTQAESLADTLRSQLWGDHLPVDPVALANRLDIKVIETPLPNNVSGGLIKQDGNTPMIVLNEKDSRQRKRFTCAHELGHYVYRVETGLDGDYEYTDLRGVLASSGTNYEEKFANRFAGALLLPQESVKKLFKEESPVFMMATQFDVSAEAMQVRLRVLDLGLPLTCA
jgi:Zn-dependent peptidase ImmA (M78 family)